MEEHLDIWIKISQQIGELNASIKNMLDKIANHENRITVLEAEKKSGCGLKDQLIMWLVKGLLVALGIIATSAGAASVLKPILGM